MAEFFSYLSWFKIVLLVVGLMSGILSIIREFLITHHPERVNEKRLFWTSVRVAFVISAIGMWVFEHNEVISLHKQISALQETQFKIQTLGAIIGDDSKGAHVTLVLRIDNTGATSAVPEDSWEMVATTQDGTPHHAAMLMLSPGNNDFCLNHDDLLLGAKRFVPEDALYEKASHPITAG